MKQAVWAPIRPDGTIDEAELRRPSATAEPATWEVTLFGGGDRSLGNRTLVDWLARNDRKTGAVFYVISANPSHRFIVRVLDVEPLYEFSHALSHYPGGDGRKLPVDGWPPNATLVSPVLTTQAEADAALPALLAVKAARREAVFAPTEEIDLAEWIFCDDCREGPYGPGAIEDRLNNAMGGKPWRECGCSQLRAARVRGGAPEHVASLREQCKSAGVQFIEEAPHG